MHPIVFKFWHLTIYSYGMMVGLAFLTGIYIAKREAARKNIKIDLIYDFSFYLIIGSLIGARIYYTAFFNPAGFLEDPVSILKIWEGGLAIHGAILGGIITGFIFSKIYKIPFLELADLIAPLIMLGQAIGRIGCFLNGCCFGVPTGSLFGVRFPKNSLPDIAYGGLAVYPVQLYESILNFIGFLILWSLRKRIKFRGGLFLLYLMAYSIARLIVSPFRGDNLYLWGTNFKIADLVSGVVLIIAFILFIKKRNA